MIVDNIYKEEKFSISHRLSQSRMNKKSVVVLVRGTSKSVNKLIFTLLNHKSNVSISRQRYGSEGILQYQTRLPAPILPLPFQGISTECCSYLRAFN